MRQRAKFLAIGSTIAKIWRYFDFSRWRSPPSWSCKFLKILTVGRLNRAELRRRTKFGRNRSKRDRDMAIFLFFKMAAAAILDFSNFNFLTVERHKGPNSVALPNLVEIGQNAAVI